MSDKKVPTVFVDVDDTLVIFKNEANNVHPYGVINGEEFEPNYKLIKKLKDFSGDIVVWSGGGKEYAQKVARMVLLPKGIKYKVGSKFEDFSAVKLGDIIVDDQKEYYIALEGIGVHVFSPFEEWTGLKEAHND